MGDIRNVQKTGDMHYVYLPTSWCKENKISSGSKIMLERGPFGSLVVSPKLVEKEAKHIELSIDEKDIDVLNKLIVSCYINPAASFKIHLEKKMDFAKILDQKKLVSVEFVELDGNTIKCESGMLITDPEALLRTMLNKIKNLVMVLLSSYNLELVEKYEEEIDRNKLLVDKAVIASLTSGGNPKSKIIDLHYTALISKDLERMTDHLIKVDKNETKFLKIVLKIIDNLKNLIEEPSKFNYKSATEFTKDVNELGDIKVKDINSYEKRRVQRNLNDISEILLDKSVTNEVEKSK